MREPRQSKKGSTGTPGLLRRQPAQENGAALPAGPSVLRLQREYGNRFVGRVLGLARPGVQREEKAGEEEKEVRRKPAASASVIRRLADETQRTDRLRTLLKDDDEKGAIEVMGQLDKTEAQNVLGSREFKELAVDSFDNEEMYLGVHAMKGDLYPSLQWMFDEGTDWEKVRSVLKDAPSGHKDVLADDWMKDQFVGICNDEEMAAAVKLLGGTLLRRLKWLVAEGASARWIFEAIRLAPDAELADVANGKDNILADLHDLLSAADYQRAKQMASGLLHWEEVEKDYKEQHYERETPASPWEMKTFAGTGAYEILYTRTELKIIVRIRLKGVEVPPAQRTIWLNGIQTYWKDQFHIENGRRLPIVFEPSFTDESPHHTVEVHDTGDKCKRADQTNWCHNFVNPPNPPFSSRPDTVAHEFGHMVGLEDEYRLATADYTRLMSAPPPPGAEPAGGYTLTGIMGDKKAGAQQRHLQAFLDWLNAHRLPSEKDKPYRLVRGAA